MMIGEYMKSISVYYIQKLPHYLAKIVLNRIAVSHNHDMCDYNK
jgi:hypothetical protein